MDLLESFQPLKCTEQQQTWRQPHGKTAAGSSGQLSTRSRWVRRYEPTYGPTCLRGRLSITLTLDGADHLP